MEALLHFDLLVFVQRLMADLQKPVTIVEMVATILSCSGAYLVAHHGHGRRAIAGWAAWVTAGVLWMGFAASLDRYFMLITQCYFFYTACVGLRKTRKMAGAA